MVRRGVESLEVVVLGLDLWAVSDFVAHADEDVLDLAQGLHHQVQMPQRGVPTRQSHVDAVVREAVHQLVRLKRLAAGFQLVFERFADEVADLADLRSLLRRKLRDASEEENEFSLPAQKPHTYLLERGQIGSRPYRRKPLGVNTPEVFPGDLLENDVVRSYGFLLTGRTC